MKYLFTFGLILGSLFSISVTAGIYTDQGDGTVIDNVSELTWQQEDDNQNDRTWEAALAYCEALELASLTDWRLPNVKELESITDIDKSNPSIDAIYFPNTNTTSYWTSTTAASDNATAFTVEFLSSYVRLTRKIGLSNILVRCVRN